MTMDFVTGLPIGMLFGIAIGIGIGSGMASGRSAVHKKLGALVTDGEIKVTDSDGNEVVTDQLIALISDKR